MSDPIHIDGHTRAGTIGGTVLVLLTSLATGDVLKAMVLAAAGATVSFFVSLFWKWLLEKKQGKK